MPKQVFDGYDTSYSDNGNGQFTEVQTPRYRTEYETEYYDEPVYRDDPVYQTKYYYDIDRWLEISPLTTSGSDHDPFWADTDLPNEVSSPKYGDRRQAGRTETYNVIAETKKGKEKTFEYSLDEWESLKIGDKIEQEGLRFE